MWPGTEAVWAGPASHTPSYHIWQKLVFSKFKDLISERAEEVAHGECWPRSTSPALELWVLGWHMAAVVAPGVPRLVPIVVFTGLGPQEAVASWDLEGSSSVPPAEG